MKFILFALMFHLASAAAEPALPPDTPVGKVSQIFKDKKKTVVTLENGIKADSLAGNLVFTNKNAESCEGKIDQRTGDKVVVDFGNCPIFDAITAGEVLKTSVLMESVPEPTAAAPAPKAVESKIEEPQQPRVLRGFAALNLTASHKARFNSVTYTQAGLTQTGEQEYDIEGAIGLSGGFLYSRPESWGMSGAVTFETKREISTSALTLNGTKTSVAYTGTKPAMQFSFVEFNALYRWGYFYLPFGLNYSFVTFNPGSTGLEIDAKGAMGGQLGAGFLIGDHLAVELVSQALAVKVTTTAPGLTGDLGTGTVSNFTVRGAYLF